MVRPEDGRGRRADGGAARRAAGFPFYGTMSAAGRQSVLARSAARAAARSCGRSCWRSSGIEVGDAIVIGGQPFTVRGVIAQEPGRRVGAFSFGSRVLSTTTICATTGLLTFGSRASYQILLRVRDDARRAARRSELRRDFRDRFVRRGRTGRREDDIGEDLLRAENYLSLVGFVIVVLGGIGVWSVTRVFVQQKIRSVAILKCVGATTRQVLATYVAAGRCCSALAGSLLGVGIAAVAIAAIPRSAAAAFGDVPYGLTVSAALQGVAVGLLVSLLFALVPLLEVRRVKPLLLLRGGDMTAASRAGRTGVRRLPRWQLVPLALLGRRSGCRSAPRSLVTAALVGVAAWQAASLAVGADRLRRVRRHRAGAPWRGRRCRSRGAAAGRRAMVPAASRGAQPAPSRQPDARDPARRRARQLLRPRRPRAAGEPARAVLARARAGRRRTCS